MQTTSLPPKQKELFAGDNCAYGKNPNDVVYTSDHTAKIVVDHFRPSGVCLDPCKGGGAFVRQMPSSHYCEIREGSDFFDWDSPVDWIVSNPPWSVYTEFLRHSFSVADNVVYVIPIAKAFGTSSMLELIHGYGGIVEILHLGSGRKLGFDTGLAVGAVHYKRNYRGGINYCHSVE